MELVLTRQSETQISVTCDNQPSHSFDLQTLLLQNKKDEEELLNDPKTYGRKLFAALFPKETPAYRTLIGAPDRILLVTTNNDVDAVPWEYTYGPYGSEDSESFLVQECHFVRGLPADQRIPAPRLDSSLHIVAVPSNPLSHQLDTLDIDGEWMRLKESIEALPYAITLERARPRLLSVFGTSSPIRGTASYISWDTADKMKKGRMLSQDGVGQTITPEMTWL